MESYQLNNILIKLRLIWPYSTLLTSEVHSKMIVVPLFSQEKELIQIRTRKHIAWTILQSVEKVNKFNVRRLQFFFFFYYFNMAT